MIDYASDTVVPGNKVPEPNTPRKSSRTATNHFPDRITAHALTALRATSTIEEESSPTSSISNNSSLSMPTRAKRLSENLAIAEAHTDYIFKPLNVDELL